MLKKWHGHLPHVSQGQDGYTTVFNYLLALYYK